MLYYMYTFTVINSNESRFLYSLRTFSIRIPVSVRVYIMCCDFPVAITITPPDADVFWAPSLGKVYSSRSVRHILTGSRYNPRLAKVSPVIRYRICEPPCLGLRSNQILFKHFNVWSCGRVDCI